MLPKLPILSISPKSTMFTQLLSPMDDWTNLTKLAKNRQNRQFANIVNCGALSPNLPFFSSRAVVDISDLSGNSQTAKQMKDLRFKYEIALKGWNICSEMLLTILLGSAHVLTRLFALSFNGCVRLIARRVLSKICYTYYIQNANSSPGPSRLHF